MVDSIVQGNEEGFTINRGKLDSLNVYDVTEDELEKLETGSSDSIFLNFSIFAFSIAIPFLITLFTIPIESNRIFYVFLIVTILGLLGGTVLLVLWRKNRTPIKKLAEKIRERIQEENEN